MRENCKQEHVRDKETQGNLGTPTVIQSAKEGVSGREMGLLDRMRSDPGGPHRWPNIISSRFSCLSIPVLLNLERTAAASGKENEYQTGCN